MTLPKRVREIFDYANTECANDAQMTAVILSLVGTAERLELVNSFHEYLKEKQKAKKQ